MLIFDAWLSLVEHCVRDAEVASSNLVATTKNKLPQMWKLQTVDKAPSCEGAFLVS